MIFLDTNRLWETATLLNTQGHYAGSVPVTVLVGRNHGDRHTTDFHNTGKFLTSWIQALGPESKTRLPLDVSNLFCISAS